MAVNERLIEMDEKSVMTNELLEVNIKVDRHKSDPN